MGFSRKVAALVTIGLSFASSPIYSQSVEFSVGAGLSIPLGDYDNVAKLGWQGTAAVLLKRGTQPFGFQLDATYGEFDLEGPFDVKERFIYGTGNLLYSFKTSEDTRLRPYLIGGLGVYNSKGTGSDAPAFGETSETKFGLNAGAGLTLHAGDVGFFLEGRFHNIFADPSSKQLVPLTIGVRFGGGR